MLRLEIATDGRHYFLGEFDFTYENFHRLEAPVGPTTRITLFLEDVILVVPPSDKWPRRPIHAFDSLTGTYHSTYLLQEELEALLRLAVAGDCGPSVDADYRTLEIVLSAWPDECRPVP